MQHACSWIAVNNAVKTNWRRATKGLASQRYAHWTAMYNWEFVWRLETHGNDDQCQQFRIPIQTKLDERNPMQD